LTDENLEHVERVSLKERAISELKAYIYITLYFWVLLVVFDMFRDVTLRQYGLNVVNAGYAIVNALVLAKVALVTEAVYSKQQGPAIRLAYRVLTHSLLLTAILIVFNLIEEGIKSYLHHESLTAHYDVATFAFILGKAAVFFIMLIPFCAFQELAALLGSGPLMQLFFDPPAGKHYALVRETTDM
jgi:hypothetical protein